MQLNTHSLTHPSMFLSTEPEKGGFVLHPLLNPLNSGDPTFLPIRETGNFAVAPAAPPPFPPPLA